MDGTLASPAVSARRAWPPVLAALALLIGAELLLYRDTAASIVAIWTRSETFMHGYLVVPIVAWLLWRQRQELAAQTPRPNAWLLVPIAVLGVAWSLGELATALAVTQPALVALIVASVIAMIGWRAARTIAFPLAFLFFAVPAGEFLVPQFMVWTADFTVAALRLSGIPVYREGLHFVLPSGNWSVIEACSGVRYLIASLMVGVLFAYLNYRSLRRRLIFVAVSIVVPIVANWVRAYLIVLLGHLSNNQLAAGVDHVIYGWVFFGVVIAAMFAIGMRWAEDPAPSNAAATAAPGAERARPAWAWAVAAGVALLAVAPQLAVQGVVGHEDRGAPRLSVVPAKTWKPSDTALAEWSPRFIEPSAHSQQSFERGGHVVGLYVGYYRQQTFERKLVGSQNVLVPARDRSWAQEPLGTRTLDIDGSAVRVKTARVRALLGPSGTSGPRLAVWQIYWVNGTLTTSEYAAKAYGALYRLLGRGDDAAVLIAYAAEDLPGDADALLEAFMKDNLRALEVGLRRTRDGD